MVKLAVIPKFAYPSFHVILEHKIKETKSLNIPQRKRDICMYIEREIRDYVILFPVK